MMYQDIIDGLILPNPELVKGFFTQDDWFYIDLADKEPWPAFELTESLRKSEFVQICKMIAGKLIGDKDVK